ncbi:MAG: electron transport complex subunit E [Oscillospiraceae bacterium]|jgi:electron transport complex protein RnfE|nr:electron transport complex subunit E [Oscillospiraceae bacterium]
MKRKMDILLNGIFKENPVLILILGCCSTLAISVTVLGSLGMGAALTFVLVCSNVVISALRKIIPDKVRIPCYIIVVATFVTLVQMVVQAFMPPLYDALGIFLPLIVVNCIVLGRAEMFANKNTIGDSFFDGLGMGIGYTMVLSAMAVVRELFGAGSLLGKQIIPEEYTVRILAQTPGGFFMFGAMMALLVWGLARHGKKFEPEMGCGEDGCGGCAMADSCTSKEKKEAANG